jgi:hypothetical protein
MLHACADDTIDKLKRLHPEGNLNFNHRVPPYMQDDLAFPATLPSSDVYDPQASVTSDCSVSRCLVCTVTLSLSFFRSAVTE